MTTPDLPPYVLPGQPLPTSTSLSAGPGTLSTPSGLISTLSGTPTISASGTLTVSLPAALPSLPTLNSIVLCTVTRISPRQATVSILPSNIQGVLRVQDIRATEKDKVKVFESFRPGDVVRARVISMGDVMSYYLSTAGNQLGVVMARSESGEVMVPVSWNRMREVRGGKEEARKVAKPI